MPLLVFLCDMVGFLYFCRYYCTANTTDFSIMACPEGYYCPNGTEYSFQFPCPPGTYNALQLGTSQDDCQLCPGGEYCEGQGNAAPTGNCTAGWYCSGGADSKNSTTHGGRCQPGYYCPEGKCGQVLCTLKSEFALFWNLNGLCNTQLLEGYKVSPLRLLSIPGSADQTPCPGGSFCQYSGLDTPTDLCAAGFYCAQRATTGTPVDGNTGDVCPAGFYCTEGSSWPTPCEPGTYSPSQGNTNVTLCLPCVYGEYCGDYNLTATSGMYQHVLRQWIHKLWTMNLSSKLCNMGIHVISTVPKSM